MSDLLARIIFAEAAGESDRGKELVGQTILNRMASKRFPTTLEDVVFQPHQFSAAHYKTPLWRATEKPEGFTGANKTAWESSKRMADRLTKGYAADPKGTTLYYNPKLASPKWNFSLLDKVMEEGGHTFYKYK